MAIDAIGMPELERQHSLERDDNVVMLHRTETQVQQPWQIIREKALADLRELSPTEAQQAWEALKQDCEAVDEDLEELVNRGLDDYVHQRPGYKETFAFRVYETNDVLLRILHPDRGYIPPESSDPSLIALFPKEEIPTAPRPKLGYVRLVSSACGPEDSQ